MVTGLLEPGYDLILAHSGLLPGDPAFLRAAHVILSFGHAGNDLGGMRYPGPFAPFFWLISHTPDTASRIHRRLMIAPWDRDPAAYHAIHDHRMAPGNTSLEHGEARSLHDLLEKTALQQLPPFFLKIHTALFHHPDIFADLRGQLRADALTVRKRQKSNVATIPGTWHNSTLSV